MIDNFTKLFAERTHCMIFQASQPMENYTSWIGGNAPVFFDDKTDLIPKDYYFYLSLANPCQQDRMVSIFVPADFEEYLQNNIYPNCSIKIINHPVSSESTENIFTHPEINKHAISDGRIISNEESMEKSFFIKFGGTPRLIQDENYYVSQLTEDSLAFLFQVDEDGYPDTLLEGNYPFGFGALYIYSEITDNKIHNPIAGFWQFS